MDETVGSTKRSRWIANGCANKRTQQQLKPFVQPVPTGRAQPRTAAQSHVSQVSQVSQVGQVGQVGQASQVGLTLRVIQSRV